MLVLYNISAEYCVTRDGSHGTRVFLFVVSEPLNVSGSMNETEKQQKARWLGVRKESPQTLESCCGSLFLSSALLLCHLLGHVLSVSVLFTARQLKCCCWLTGNVVGVFFFSHVGLRPDDCVRCFWTSSVKKRIALDRIGANSTFVEQRRKKFLCFLSRMQLARPIISIWQQFQKLEEHKRHHLWNMYKQ